MKVRDVDLRARAPTTGTTQMPFLVFFDSYQDVLTFVILLNGFQVSSV